MSFLTGFATGLAKSVDTQLKESIERTRDNIDMVSKWRLKKAEEREKERKAKDTELKTLIQDAAFVISGDQNNLEAQNMAAALYKQRGLSGFSSDIEFMRKQTETGGPGVRPLDYIKRANMDAPENKFKLSEIIRSLSDAESSFASPDMIFPKGTIKGSGLISSLVPDFDVTAAGGAQAKDQMKKIGFETTPTASSIAFTRYNFDREGMNYHSMDTNSKLNYLQDIIVNTSSTEDAVKTATKRRDALLNLAMEQGDDKTALTAIDQSLSQMNPLNADGSENTEYSNLITDRKQISRKITLQEAQLEGESAVLRAQAVIAAADGDVTTATRLNREADDKDAGGFTPLEIQIARIDEDIQRNLAKHGDAYRNSDGAFAGKGMAEDIAGRNRLKTREANLKGTTLESVNAAFNQIYSTAKTNLANNNPELAALLKALSPKDLADSTQLSKIIELMKDSGKDAVAEMNKAIEEAIKINMDQAVAEGWNTRSITLAAQKFQGLDLSSISASSTTGVTQTDQNQTDQTNTVLGSQTQPVPPNVTTDTGSEVDRGEDVNFIELTDNQITDLQQDYPSNIAGATKWLFDSLDSDSSYSTLFDEAARVHKGTGFQDNIKMIVQKADDALEATGSVSTAFGTTTLHPTAVDRAKESLMKDLGIDDATASKLVDIARDNLNSPVSSQFLTEENITRFLRRKNRVVTTITGKERIPNIDLTVKNLANKFTISEGRASDILSSMYPEQFETSPTKVEDVVKEDVKTALEALEKDEQQNQSFSGPLSNNPFFDEQTGFDMDMERTTSDARKNRLIKRRPKSKPTSIEDAAEAQFRERPDLTTGKEVSRSSKPKRKSLMADDPARNKTAASSDSDMQTQDMNLSDVKSMTNVALITRYISGKMTDAMVAEFKRRLSSASFVDQATAIIKKVDKAKSKTKAKARGGLMGK